MKSRALQMQLPGALRPPDQGGDRRAVPRGARDAFLKAQWGHGSCTPIRPLRTWGHLSKRSCFVTWRAMGGMGFQGAPNGGGVRIEGEAGQKWLKLTSSTGDALQKPSG